jgi:hypothetical protein
MTPLVAAVRKISKSLHPEAAPSIGRPRADGNAQPAKAMTFSLTL